MIKEGDIVEIPLPDGRTAIGWILYISSYFKNCVGFIVFGIKDQVREDVVREFGSRDPDSMLVLGPLYTSMAAIKHYGWRSIGSQSVSTAKRYLTQRDVAGEIYIGDEHMGPTDPDKSLPRMELLGMPLVYREIESAFEKE